MVLVFATEARFVKDKEGRVYSQDGSFSKTLWLRYLQHFEQIKVVARVKYDPDYKGHSQYLSSDEFVNFIEIPYYLGPFQYLIKRQSVITKIKKFVANNKTNHVFLARVPGRIGTLLIRVLRLEKMAYGLEVVGDPWEVFAPGSVKHPLRLFFRVFGYYALKKNVSSSSAAIYVTKKQLQKRYPVKAEVFATHASNVKIDESWFAVEPKQFVKKPAYTIVSVGSLAQMYKSPDVLIKAIKMLNTSGLNCRIVWCGDGKYKANMIALTKKMALENYISFVGNVESNNVKEILTNADLFVLASRTEGLPRALIEAMARGLPCIGAKVGGIPELLDKNALVKPGSAKELAQKIRLFLSNPLVYNTQSQKNLNEAKNYLDNKLQKRRKEFFKKLKSINYAYPTPN